MRAWFEFHWVRVLKLLIHDSITTVHEILDSDLGDFGALGEANQRANQQLIQALRSDWQNHFVELIRGIGEREAQVASRAEILALAEPLVTALRGLEANENLGEISRALEQVDRAVSQRLDRTRRHAVDACVQFNRKRSTESGPLYGVTANFSVPVCDGVPDMTRVENTQKDFHTLAPYLAEYPREAIFEEVPLAAADPAPEVPVASAQRGFRIESILDAIGGAFLSSAYAAKDLDEELAERKVYIYRLRRIIPRSAESYRQPAIFRVPSPESLRRYRAFHLHALAFLAGAHADWEKDLGQIEAERNGSELLSNPRKLEEDLASHRTVIEQFNAHRTDAVIFADALAGDSDQEDEYLNLQVRIQELDESISKAQSEGRRLRNLWEMACAGQTTSEGFEKLKLKWLVGESVPGSPVKGSRR